MARAPGIVLVVVAAVALGADCLASDRPILLSKDDRLYLLPNLIEYDELGELRGARLEEELDASDWALWPPLRHDPLAVRSHGVVSVLQPPSSHHLLGTDDRGRDVASRVVHGARLSLWLALWTALVASVLGALLALLATWRGAIVESTLLAVCDAVAAIPVVLAVLAIRGLVGSGSIVAAIAILAVPRAAHTARLVREGLRGAMHAPFAEAAFAIGCSRARVLVRHALPQTYQTLKTAAAITAATTVLAEVALSFLGLGVPPPAPSWGELLRQAHDNQLHWWLLVPAGLATTILSMALGGLARSDARPLK